MKSLFFYLFFIVLAMPNIASASFFIVNQDNEVIAKTEYIPDAKDLSLRKEIFVETKDDISISQAEYRNGKIIKHVETTKEKAAREKEKKRTKELAAINNKMLSLACKSLESEGTVFSEVNCDDLIKGE